MSDLTWLAFELADEYRMPAIILADGYTGQMMEPVDFPAQIARPRQKSWAVEGTAETRNNLLTSIYMDPNELEEQVQKLEARYRRAEQREARAELWQVEDAEIILVGYGITARILKAVVEEGRSRGLPLGLLRPITLYPFPVSDLLQLSRQARLFVVVEMSTGQLVDDIRLFLEARTPVEFYGRCGGNVPSAEEILDFVCEKASGYVLTGPASVSAELQGGKVTLG
jgi:pyruvate/2-oxoacid:ferredoxin oxidoreductase alpha subunit